MLSTSPWARLRTAQARSLVPALLSSWRYHGDRRDARLDLLRGFAALAMIIDHIGGGASWLYLLSGGDRFFISAAEGFVFISGLVMGIVYAGVIARQGLRAALRKGARRVATLYGLTTGLTFSFAALSALLGLEWAPQVPPGGFPAWVLEVLTLHRAYYLTDVLVLYTLVIAAALPVLVLLRRGGAGAVLAGSWLLWAAWQVWPDQLHLPWTITGSSTFNFAAWQVLFITGLVLGYHRAALQRRLAGAAPRVRQVLRGGALVLSGATVGGSVALYFWFQAHTANTALGLQLGQLFAKADLRVGRLALFAAFFVLAFLVVTAAWTPIRRVAGWLLLPLGRDALSVYTLHLFVLAGLAAAVPWLLGATPASRLGNTLLQGGAILFIWGLVQAKVLSTGRRTAAFRWLRAWFAAHRPGIVRGFATPPPLRRLASARPLQAAVVVLVVGGLLLGMQVPAFANAVKHSLSAGAARLSAAATVVGSSAAAYPTPTGVAQNRPQVTDAFNMLLSGTAVPGVIPTPADPILPPYVEKHTFLSVSLNQTMPYYIYLPPDYATHPTERYPVLYMLHGMGGTYNEWLGYGLLGRARDMMSAGQIGQFLIVVPQGDQSYWVDHADGGPRWGTYVEQDLVTEIDSHFRTLADRQHRAIGGLSMGGYGALQLAINYPSIFGIVGADSPSLHAKADAPDFLGDQDYFNAHDPSYLYKTQANIARTLQIYLDVGQDDPWLPAIAAFHQLLVAQDIPHQWHLFPGDHGGVYWSDHVIDYLLFYSSALVPAAPATATPSPAPATATLSPAAGFATPSPLPTAPVSAPTAVPPTPTPTPVSHPASPTVYAGGTGRGLLR